MGIVCCGVQGEEELEETSAEMLYLGMLPNLSQYVVSGSDGLYFASKFFFMWWNTLPLPLQNIDFVFACVRLPSWSCCWPQLQPPKPKLTPLTSWLMCCPRRCRKSEHCCGLTAWVSSWQCYLLPYLDQVIEETIFLHRQLKNSLFSHKTQ